MRDKKYLNIFVIGLIILFAGASGISSINAKNMTESDKNSLTNTQVESLFEGDTYFILLDDYTDGAGQENHWSVQLRFDSANLIVESEYDGINLPLVLDQWVEIRVEIDLDGDWHEVYYNGDFFYEKEWTAGINNDYQGVLNIDAVDLFANGATSVYYDDISLEKLGTGVIWQENFDSYALGEDLHGKNGWKGWDNDPSATAFVTDAQSRSTPHSVDIKGPTDLVREYSSLTSGRYIYTAWQYLPSFYPGDPPEAPTITGETNGKIDTEYIYTFNAVDPDEDDVKYHIDWGDTTSIVTDFFAEGTDANIPKTYTAEGTFTITAYAEDDEGQVGPSNTLDVTMTKKSKALPTILIQIILERFPILKQLLGL